MKMAQITSRTWFKLAEIPTEDFTTEGIIESLEHEFGEEYSEEDIIELIQTGYLELCDDGLIYWAS